MTFWGAEENIRDGEPRWVGITGLLPGPRKSPEHSAAAEPMWGKLEREEIALLVAVRIQKALLPSLSLFLLSSNYGSGPVL